MATYIQGIEGYIPEIQQFQPDFNFYAKALQTKQSQYDAAKTKIADVYNSILNNPMIRDSDIAKRDEFFKIIDSDIKKIAHMDLSLEQNQREATHVFSQLLDDKNISHDMVFTKKAQSALAQGEQLRTSGDKGYWSGMTENINYYINKYKKSDDQNALSMNAPKYIKRVDIMSEVADLIKDLKFDVSEESPYMNVKDKNGNVVQVQNDWIVKKKNGVLVEPYLQAMFTAQYASRGDVRDYYNEQAKNARIHYINLHSEELGSEEAASKDYSDKTLSALDEQWSKEEQLLADLTENKKSQVSSLKRKQQESIEKGDEETAESFNSKLEEYINELQGFTSSKEFASQQMNILKNSNGDLSDDVIDSLIANIGLTGDIKKAAEIASMKGSEISYKENPYKMEDIKFQHQLAKAKIEHGYRMEEIKYKQDLKNESENKVNAAIGKLSTAYNIPGNTESNPDAPGYNVIDNIKDTQGNYLKAMGLTDAQSIVLNDAIDELRKKADSEDGGNYEAKVALVEILSRTLSAEEQKDMYDECGGDYKKLYDYVKSNGFNASSLSAYQIDDMYHQLINHDKSLYVNAYNKNTNKIGVINTKLKTYDVIWKENSKIIAAAIENMDEEKRAFARAYLGLKPEDSYESWNGKFCDFEDYWNNCKLYSLKVNDIMDMWGENKDDDEKIQDLVGRQIDKTSIKSNYAQLYGSLNGYDSKLSVGSVGQTYNNVNDPWNSSITDIIRTALGNSSSSFYYGYFQEKTPKSDEEAKNDAERIMTNLSNVQDSKSKASYGYSFTFSPIAGGDGNYIGLHIKDSKKDSEKDGKNYNSGITIVVPKKQLRGNSIIESSEVDCYEQMLYAYNAPVDIAAYNTSMDPNKPIQLYFDQNKQCLRLKGKAFVYDRNTKQAVKDFDFSNIPITYQSPAQIVDLVRQYVNDGQEYINMYGTKVN